MCKLFKKKKKRDLPEFDSKEELDKYIDKTSQIIRLRGIVSDCELEELKNIPLSEWVTIDELESLSKKRLGYFKRLADLQKTTEEELELKHKLLTKRIEIIEDAIYLPSCYGTTQYTLEKELAEARAELKSLLEKVEDENGK